MKSEMPSIDQQRTFWNDWVDRSVKWEDNPDNARRGRYVLNEVVNIGRGNLAILDIGCGSGWLSRELVKYGEVTAMDLASEPILKLQEKYPNIKWMAGDLLSLKLPKGYFDVVTCLETIAHVPDQTAFVQKIAEVMKPKGILLLTTQNGYIWNRTSTLTKVGEGQIRNWPSRQGLVELFEPYFFIQSISTCAPGGDRGLPGVFTNRLSRRLGSFLFGWENWARILELLGLGRSLVLVAIHR